MRAEEAYQGQRVFINDSMHPDTFQYEEATIITNFSNKIVMLSFERNGLRRAESRLYSQLTPINEETWLEMRVLMACVNMLVKEKFTEEDAVNEVLEMIRLYKPKENIESYREQVQQLVRKFKR